MVRNRSFTVPQSVVSMYQLEEYAHPMVGRSVQVNSLCFTKRDWKANVASEAKAHLLVFTPDANFFPFKLQCLLYFRKYNAIIILLLIILIIFVPC